MPRSPHKTPEAYSTVREKLMLAGFDPVHAMIAIARDEAVSIAVRRCAIKDLMDKSYPDLKAVEIKSDDQAVEDLKNLKDEMRALLKDNMRSY